VEHGFKHLFEEESVCEVLALRRESACGDRNLMRERVCGAGL
jgi:hypothetical protein